MVDDGLMFIHNGFMIRSVESLDLPWLAASRNHPDTWMNLLTVDFANYKTQVEWWEKTSLMKDRKYYIFCKADGTRLGFIRTDEIDEMNRSIRVGGDIHPDHRGQGYGIALYDILLKFLFDYVNMNRVWLLVLESNPRAIHLYEKIGFLQEGVQREAVYRHGKYQHQRMYSILKSEYRGNNVNETCSCGGHCHT